MSEKELVKKKLLDFYMSHLDFDDRNLNHIKEAETLLKNLRQLYGQRVLIEAIEELRDESERIVAEAREHFYEAIKRIKHS
jgi:hypothetical protein